MQILQILFLGREMRGSHVCVHLWYTYCAHTCTQMHTFLLSLYLLHTCFMHQICLQSHISSLMCLFLKHLWVHRECVVYFLHPEEMVLKPVLFEAARSRWLFWWLEFEDTTSYRQTKVRDGCTVLYWVMPC